MSNTANARSAPQHNRVPSSSFSRRGPTSRSTNRDKPPSSELVPDDSASNATYRRVPSSSSRANGGQRLSGEPPSTRISTTTTTTTRDTFRVRSKSPQKASFGSLNGGSPGIRARQEAQSPRTSVQPGQREKKSQLSWEPIVSLVSHGKSPLACRISQPPMASSIPDDLDPPPLKDLKADSHEKAILEDLLFVLMGFEGQYICYETQYDPLQESQRLKGPAFKMAKGLDSSLRELATSVLKMATYYRALEAFVEIHSQDEYGMINHALCASISRFLKEYLTLICQLEHQFITNPGFTLHQLHLHTLKTNSLMYHLYTLSQEIVKKNVRLEDDLDESIDGLDVGDLIERLDLMPGSAAKRIFKGGNVLRLLTERLSHFSGDPVARELLQTLLKDASKPYMRMLNEWLHHGSIKDPHAEFLIKEQQSIRREKLEEDYTDEYWEKRYTIRESDVPPQLEAVKEKVLLAGKYLNVVRECGGVDVTAEFKDVPHSFDDQTFLDNVNAAYAHANSSLLKLLLTTHALSGRLRSMKHYFFLDRSDFFTYFLDLSASELRKPWRLVNVGKLQSLLDLVLRQHGSVAAQDPFKEDIKIHMNDVGLNQLVSRIINVKGFDEATAQDEALANAYRTPAAPTSSQVDAENKMTGFEALEFKFSVPFPLSLVISSKTVFRYQILFRYLLTMRHLEDLLVKSWEDHNKIASWTHKTGDRKLENWKRRAWTLRARMLVFVQQTTYYCTSEVIEPNWHALMARVNGSEDPSRSGVATGPQPNRTVDELMEDHVDFLDTCLKECMLMNAKLLKIFNKLLSVSTLFATYTSSLTRTLFLLPSASPPLLKTPTHLQHLSQVYPSRAPPPEQLQPAPQKKLDDLYDTLGQYEHNFEYHLGLLLSALDYYAATETVGFGRLCAGLGCAVAGGVGSDRREG